MKEFVYYLICPIDKKVKYVGKTKKPKSRYNQHIKKLDKQLTPKREWIELLFSKNLLPILKIVEEFEGDARHLEQKHVDLNIETILNIHNPEKGKKSFKW
jgi:hypothetical protein